MVDNSSSSRSVAGGFATCALAPGSVVVTEMTGGSMSGSSRTERREYPITPNNTRAAESMLARTGRRIATSESFMSIPYAQGGGGVTTSIRRSASPDFDRSAGGWYTCPEAALHVGFQNLQEFRHDSVTLERYLEPAVDIDGRLRLLERPGQRNTDVRVL